VRQGIVVSNKGDKSITVRIDIAAVIRLREDLAARARCMLTTSATRPAEGDMVRDRRDPPPFRKTKRGVWSTSSRRRGRQMIQQESRLKSPTTRAPVNLLCIASKVARTVRYASVAT